MVDLDRLRLRVRLGVPLSQKEAEALVREATTERNTRTLPPPAPRGYRLLHVLGAALLAAVLVRACDPAPVSASFSGVELVVAELKNLVAATKEQTRTMRELHR